MKIEVTHRRNEQQPSATTGGSSHEPHALASAESHLAGADGIRRAIARGALESAADIPPYGVTPEKQAALAQRYRQMAASAERARGDFDDSMMRLGRQAILTRELGEELGTEQGRPRATSRGSQPVTSEPHVQGKPSLAQAQPVASVTRTGRSTSTGLIGGAVRETLDAGWGLVRLHCDVVSWSVRKAGAGVTAGVRFGHRVATDPVGTAAEVIEGAQNVGAAVVRGLTWAGGKLKNGFEWIVENGAPVLAAGRKVAGEIHTGIGEGFFAAGNGLIGLGKVLTGQMTWAQLSQQVSIDFSKAASHFATAGRAAFAGLSVVGGFLSDLSRSMGLTDIAFGLYKLATAGPQFASDLARVALGKATLSEALTRFGGNLSGAAQALGGGLKCLGEVTGVIDAILAAKHTIHALAAYGRDEKKAALAHLGQAALHGAFASMSWGTIAATVGTAGLAAPTIGAMVMGRTALKAGGKEIVAIGTKQFFKQGSEAIAKQVETKLAKEALGVLSKEAGGKTIVEQLTKEATQQLGGTAAKEKVAELVGQKALNHLLSATGVDAAYAGGKQLYALMKREGVHVITRESAHTVHKDAITEPLEKLLKALKFSEHISDTTLDLLKTVRDKSPRRAGSALAEALGVSRKEGVEMAKQARKSLVRGRSDEAIKEELTSGITQHFKTRFADQMEMSHKGHFKNIVTGQLDEPWAKELSEGVEMRARDLGIAKDEFVDDLVEAGWDGAKEGIERVVRKLVKAGVDDAFRRFRQMKLRAGFGDAEAAPELHAAEGVKSEEVANASVAPEGGIAEETKPSVGDMAATRQRIVHEGGDIIIVTEVFDNRDNAYHVVKTERSAKLNTGDKALAA